MGIVYKTLVKPGIEKTIKTVDNMRAHLNSPGADGGILGNTSVDRVYDDFAGSVNIKAPQNIKQTA